MGTRRTLDDRADRRASDQKTLARVRSEGQSSLERRWPRVRHCWVRQGEEAVEGLMVGWVATPAGWQAEVIVIADDFTPRTLTVAVDDVRPARAE